MRDQADDTTAAMSFENLGLQKLFCKGVPNSVYRPTPCNTHKLNLVIASLFKLSQIRKCVFAINKTFLFFNTSHKRHGFLKCVIDIFVERDQHLPHARKHTQQKKLKGLCKTRWVARFKAIDNFIDPAVSVQTTWMWHHPMMKKYLSSRT